MILQALYDYAKRKGDELPEDGFEDVEIKYLIKIREDGSLVDLISTEEISSSGKKQGHKYKKLPMRVARSGKTPKASLLLDNVGYVLLDDAKRESFISLIENLPSEVKSTKEIKAVIAFYRQNKANGFDKIASTELWEECQKTTGYLSFVLMGEDEIVPQIEPVREYQRKVTAQKSAGDESSEESEFIKGVCLITGENAVVSRLHAATPIIGSKSNAKLVGFQKNSGYDSYGKEQSYNAPVSVKAENAYTKALNYLIKDERAKENRFRLGDDTIVFWAEKQESESFESDFSAFFTAYKEIDDPDRNIRAVKNLFAAVQTGKYDKYGLDSNFYVLCLSPNAARISVRFWETGKVETFAKRIKQHFDDFEIVRPSFDDKEYLNLYQILSATALEYKMDNVAPNLIGSVMQSILKELPYPTTLQQQCIRRIRAEQKVTRERAAILKAYINRLNRQKNKKEVSVALDRTNENTGYLLGRLFAAFEKVQQESADTELNSTITDRFYGAASTNPVTVFTQLMRLNRNHMSKLKSKNRGLQINREKEIGEIMEKIDSFPAHLDLNEQSYFAIGYYHEKQSFFTKNEQTEGVN